MLGGCMIAYTFAIHSFKWHMFLISAVYAVINYVMMNHVIKGKNRVSQLVTMYVSAIVTSQLLSCMLLN